MTSRVASVAAAAAMLALAAIASAQGGGEPTTGNPTPGTQQPDPPNLADRVTVTGCLGLSTRRADPSASAKASADKSGSATADANTPSSARFELTKAERVDRVPPGTGGSPAATAASSKTYRLEGIDSQFSPFVGAKVEVSGEIKSSTSSSPPTLVVGFVQRLAATCS